MTLHKQAEETHWKSEEKFAKIFRSSPTAIAITKMSNGCLIDVNQAFEKLFGCRREEVIGRTSVELGMWYDPKDRERLLQSIAAGEPVVDREYRFRSLSGSVLIARYSAEIIELGGEPCLVSVFLDMTACKRAEESLKQSEEKFAKVFLSSPAAIAISRMRDGYLIDVNQAYEKLFGYRREEVIGRTSMEIGSWVDPDDRKKLLERIAAGDPVVDQEYRFRSKDGGVFIARYSAEIVELAGESCLLSVFLDITERKRMDEELRDSQRRMADTIEFLPDATLVIDAESRVTAWNLAMEHLTGIKSEDMLGKGNYEYALPFYGRRRPIMVDLVTKSQAELEEKYNDLQRRNGYLEAETYVPTIAGGEAYLTASAAALRDARGNICGAIECIRDMTRHKRAEEAHREIEERLRTITDTAKDAIVMLDDSGKVSFWNPAAQAMFGYAADEVLGQDFYVVLTPEKHRDLYRRGFATIQRTGRTPALGKTLELALLRRGGSEFPAEGSLSTIRIHDKWNVVAILRDITARKQAERELQNAKEAAESANRAKSAFLAVMSHEIRTPMNAIIGMSGLLLDGNLTPQQRDFAQTIRNSGESLLSIINDILDFSKIEAGRLELENHPFDLCQGVEATLDLFAHRARGKAIELGCFIEAHTPTTVIGDSNRLQQILVNLIGNAIKFTEKGEVMVTVDSSEVEAEPVAEGSGGTTARVTEQEGRMFELHFLVRDTGIGIPEERMSRLFQAFSQVDASTARKYGGTGLGLAICKRLVEMMGGRIWVVSEAGKGSAFHFTVRVRAALGAKPVYLSTDQPALSGKRVLIVDDNSTNRKILSHQVTSWGMVPIATDTGKEALEWLRRGDSFHIAVLDMLMPEMDGMTLSEQISTLPAGHSIPLVMLSSSSEEMDSAQKQRFRATLFKPVKASRLFDTFMEIFSPADKAMVSSESEEPHSPFDPEMGKRHPLSILLAEDNASNQKLAMIMLERLGYRADIAGNGIEVLEALQRQPYDVVLMDVQMPEMDGLEATRKIRRSVAAELQPHIIALTADAMEEDRKQCFAAGMNDYVSKPIQVQSLVSALNRSPAKETAAAPSLSDGTRPQTADRNPDESPPAEHKIGPIPEETQAGGAILDLTAVQRVKQTLGKRADEIFLGLLENFLDDCVRLLADARGAMQRGSMEDLRRATHTLKSHSATFGATALSATARNLEQLARQGTLEGASELIARAEQEYAKAKAALEGIKGKD